jgi:hypothetical protein
MADVHFVNLLMRFPIPSSAACIVSASCPIQTAQNTALANVRAWAAREDRRKSHKGRGLQRRPKERNMARQAEGSGIVFGKIHGGFVPYTISANAGTSAIARLRRFITKADIREDFRKVETKQDDRARMDRPLSRRVHQSRLRERSPVCSAMVGLVR